MSEPAVSLQNRWAGAAVVLAITVLTAVTVALTAWDLAERKSQSRARAFTANATAPVADALRTAMDDAAAGTAPGEERMAPTDTSTDGGVSSATVIRARDSGQPVLDDSGSGVVVVATYDTPSVPATVADRRRQASGIRVVPLGLGRTLHTLRPARGGIALAGPNRTVQSVPGARPAGRPAYSVKLAPGPAPDWTLTVWAAAPSISPATWLTVIGILLAGGVGAGWLVRRDDGSRRNQRELLRLREASATTAALATVAQHSLDLADLLPSLTTELSTALGLHGLSLGAPNADGERQFFAWGATPASVPPASGLPDRLGAGDTLCLHLARGGRIVATLRVVAGRDLDHHDLTALGAATEVLTSALVNAEAFAQQRDLVQRMRSVDELKTVFLATASHELRTPVGVIMGYAQLLASSWDSLGPEEIRACAEQVDSNAQRLGTLVEDLLDFSRLERGIASATPDSVLDLGATVRQILDEQPDLAPDHEVVHQVHPGLEVSGSVPAVERVVSNLVGNAGKYSPAGTTIRVLVEEHHDRAELVVEDEGPGVPPAEREQVFSRFFRGGGDTVVATRGAGLGLAIVSEFAASMGGQVSVTSADSGGARFVVSYPLVGARGSSTERSA